MYKHRITAGPIRSPARALIAVFVLQLFASDAAIAIDFAHEIVPILREHCVKCHGGPEAKGGFSINSRESFLESDAAVPGNPAESHFLELMNSSDDEIQMPPKDRPRVPSPQRKKLAEWVDAQMPWTEGFTFAEKTYEPPLRPRQVELPPGTQGNPIDRILSPYRSQRELASPEPIDDEVFLRRVHLDLVGLLPTAGQYSDFIADASADKRTRLVDDLLADETAYAEHWLTFWNDLLRNDYAGTGFITGGRKQISGWLYDGLKKNKPFDDFTRELIAPPGNDSRGFIDGIKWRGDVSAGQTVEIQFAQSVAQSFLGINLKCASCHDSFIDRWKLSEAYGLAAIYSNRPLPIHRCDKPTGEVAAAAWLFPELGKVDPSAEQPERLRQLSLLMTHSENGRFTRTIVNRLWAQLMGRGIVHPLDAMHTEPWNADLLDFLANYLVEHDCDLKAVLRVIATSKAYGSRSEILSDVPSESGYVFAGPRAKRMTAEQFVDAVWRITGAAPTEFDAPIVRGDVDPVAADAMVLEGQWIWGDSAADGGVPPGGEQLVMRKTVKLDSPVARGAAVVSADNALQMYVARREVAASEDWTRVKTVPMSGLLKKGDNEILVIVRNFLDTPNLAAFYFEAHLELAGGERINIVSDDSWTYSENAPKGGREGRLGKVEGPWKPVTTLGNPAVYLDKIGPQMRKQLVAGLSSDMPMVRAALLKSDFLMRSLGRPNRDQIVTSRPSDLTTLEAIDLSNGETLAKMLESGARRMSGRSLSAESIVRTLFQTALSREPTAAELETLAAVLGEDPESQAIEDVLWAVCMLPEFMIVR